MLIKATIIGWIIFGIVTFIHRCVMNSLSDAEILALQSFNILPKRAKATTYMWLVTIIADIVLTVITIVKW